eukprot:gnl/TRDRNA2_/TRDRNA2_89133_c0_seq2.p1 gnl/TRDRNA2_/TRDRNA2_89133_c0~~gnl/TRDRNA2_/TRDRNA2_89133_c0_seq2.p1  ORF type:complete len:268 (+),score=49.97 gnl/TRDRNA2_/TRDRNA2_89133_c0_seq2:77-880(+)
MGTTTCRCCNELPAAESSAPPVTEVSVADESGVWEEVLCDSRYDENGLLKLGMSSQLLPPPQKHGQQKLAFDLVGVELQALSEPKPALVVGSVHPEGSLARTSGGGPGLCPGDMLIEVQSQQGSPPELFEHMRRLCGEPGRLEVVVRQRPLQFNVDVLRRGRNWQRLGLSVAIKGEKGYLLIAKVHDTGLAVQWNARNNEHCICAGDRIVGVNRIIGDAIAMYSAVQATGLGGRLQLRIEPPPRVLVTLIQAWANQALESGEQLETL